MNNISMLHTHSVNLTRHTTHVKTDQIEAYTQKEELSITSSTAAVYEKSEETPQVTYKPDMEKIKAMKDETDRRLIDLFKNTVKKGTLRQLGGFRGFVERFRAGEIEAVEVDFEVTEEAVAKAQQEIGPDGYWGAEQTSDRFLEFAQALSGGDPAKADLLLDAVKEGYKQAEEIWGGELPELSQKTLDMTIKKFEAWRDGVEYVPEEEETDSTVVFLPPEEEVTSIVEMLAPQPVEETEEVPEVVPEEVPEEPVAAEPVPVPYDETVE